MNDDDPITFWILLALLAVVSSMLLGFADHNRRLQELEAACLRHT